MLPASRCVPPQSGVLMLPSANGTPHVLSVYCQRVLPPFGSTETFEAVLARLMTARRRDEGRWGLMGQLWHFRQRCLGAGRGPYIPP